jgi:hypothetical protein
MLFDFVKQGKAFRLEFRCADDPLFHAVSLANMWSSDHMCVDRQQGSAIRCLRRCYTDLLLWLSVRICWKSSSARCARRRLS